MEKQKVKLEYQIGDVHVIVMDNDDVLIGVGKAGDFSVIIDKQPLNGKPKVLVQAKESLEFRHNVAKREVRVTVK